MRLAYLQKQLPHLRRRKRRSHYLYLVFGVDEHGTVDDPPGNILVVFQEAEFRIHDGIEFIFHVRYIRHIFHKLTLMLAPDNKQHGIVVWRIDGIHFVLPLDEFRVAGVTSVLEINPRQKMMILHQFIKVEP